MWPDTCRYNRNDCLCCCSLQVEEHNGHIFKSTQYSIPTYCEFCSSLIWMMDRACVCKRKSGNEGFNLFPWSAAVTNIEEGFDAVTYPWESNTKHPLISFYHQVLFILLYLLELHYYDQMVLLKKLTTNIGSWTNSNVENTAQCFSSLRCLRSEPDRCWDVLFFPEPSKGACLSSPEGLRELHTE